jgi:hypothetical protein
LSGGNTDTPCDGDIAELPPSGYDETWRHIHGTRPPIYAQYERHGAVFRYAGRTLTLDELTAEMRASGANVTLGVDSRRYER